MNSPLSSPCSEGTDSYSLDEIEERAEQNISDDVQGENEMESPFEAEYVLWQWDKSVYILIRYSWYTHNLLHTKMSISALAFIKVK